MHEADQAMYGAKQDGGDRAGSFGPRLRRRLARRHAIEERLRGAIRDGCLNVEYQPIVDLGGGALVAVEALVRLPSPRGPGMRPTTFLEIARAAGMIQQLDLLVRRHALQQASAWQTALHRPVPLSLNTTARDLSDPNFAPSLVNLIVSHGLRTEDVLIELPQPVLSSASGPVRSTVAQLRGAGVQVGLDGLSGTSSLESLAAAPMDFAKLDRSLVARLSQDERAVAVVAALVQLCRAYGLRVIAEGVETPQQRDLLAACGCEQAQGFLFAASCSPGLVMDYVRVHGLGAGVRS
jgi:EAL domain-containing protein (putative c-di-GMP-specific phosphodiesterase class I)